MRLLLISNTGRPYLEYCASELLHFLGKNTSIAFVSAASLGNEVEYFEAITTALLRLDPPGSIAEVYHLRWDSPDYNALEKADAVLVGGGNTFALVKRLTESGLMDGLRKRVLAGLPYVGISAGANITGPNILTTNDWNVVRGTSFDALALVPFNVNPHYVERGTSEGATGESRDDRIKEYHLLWDNPVIAVEEGGLLSVETDTIMPLGVGRTRLFYRGARPHWLNRGETMGMDAIQARPTDL